MGEHFWMAFGASLSAGLITVAGIQSIRRYEEWARRNTTYFASFAAGVLISVSFMHIVPSGLLMNAQAPAWLLAGYLLMHAFDRFLTACVCDNPESSDYALGLVPLLGIGLHSFIDGIIYSVTFTVSLYTGALVAIGMVLHEFPEGIVTYTLLVRSGFSPRRSFLLAFLAAGATTPIGTAVSYPFLSQLNTPLLGSLLAFSAGALIYVAATHLLPCAQREPRRFSLIALVSGVLVAIGIVLSDAN